MMPASCANAPPPLTSRRRLGRATALAPSSAAATSAAASQESHTGRRLRGALRAAGGTERVEAMGIEPTTYGLQSRRSAGLSYAPARGPTVSAGPGLTPGRMLDGGLMGAETPLSEWGGRP